MPLVLRNRYAKDIGGIVTGQKIIHKKVQEGVVLTPSLSIGGLTQWACCKKASAYGYRVGWTLARIIRTWFHVYGIGQTIKFSCCGFYLSVFFFSSPNLSRRRVDVCHTCTHGVALVRI